jgi:NAD(P)-dependent dehydrogenase (short-subunit alcohol dehydrogenase family)
MTATRALITGITGQDGSYLAEHLLELGYEVHGLVRRVSQPNFTNLAGVIDKVTLHTGDMTDGPSLFRIVRDVAPDEIYNLAAMSQVRDSYDHPEVTQDINAGGLLRLMEACRTLGLDPKIYQACSSEMFGRVQETPQTERTAFYPRSPYGASKVAAFNHARCWREAYGTRVYCGIFSTMNHHGGVRPFCRARSRSPPPRSPMASAKSSSSATSMPSAIGVTPKNMSAGSTGSCNTRSPMILSSRPAKHIRSKSLSRARFSEPESRIGSALSIMTNR